MTPRPARPISGIEIRPIGPDDWPMVEALFGARGACGGCWCMSWRVPRHGKDWEAAKGEPNRRRLRALVRKGAVHAVVAIADGSEPVAWCSFGPRETFPKLLNSRALQRASNDGIWSIVCFFIPKPWRRKGLGTALLRAATEEAWRLGAREVEGFPAVPWDAKVPVPAAFAWTGVPAQFEALGFERLARRAGSNRPIYVATRPAASKRARS